MTVPSSSTPAPSGPAPALPRAASLTSFLGTTRTLTWVWVLLAGLVALIDLLEILLTIFALRFPLGGLEGLAYAVIWGVVDLFILARIGGWRSELERGRYAALQEPFLLWGILGTIFGILPGLLLLVAYVRVLPWSDEPAGSAGASSASPSATNPPPPPYGVSPSAPGGAATKAGEN
ncbi:MAG: hypothetical protein KGJ23_00315 [Euryarchaeota archaeon]|nr:hypothetical protein [Euryarchaeota archaeon]MDE1835039.1 hypothetical protein [Euryarchaeota archaeon]MDE1879310.1 hypothetical protein [Euryarchaeota archaeon]MDE2044878.1 hypothetical protein [Thermoplasmata archaeon]